MDPYAVLGLRRGATKKEVRTAYLRLAREWHPDCNRSPGAAERFLQIRKAYDVLSAGGTLTAEVAEARADAAAAFSREVLRRMQEAFGASISSLEEAGFRVTIKYKTG
jgi:curved DNA-binding protein CbpA